MLEINTSRFRLPPTNEQIEGIKHLALGSVIETDQGKVIRPNTALFDRPGFGKTKQFIDAACILFDNQQLDVVIVVAPKSVCSTWDEPDTEFGEIAKHSWKPYTTQRFKKDTQILQLVKDHLNWITISYGMIRKKVGEKYPVADTLIKQLKGKRVWLVLDESSFIKSKESNQFKGCLRLTKVAERVTLLNGTPVSQGVIDLYSQFVILDPMILSKQYWLNTGEKDEYLSFPQFRAMFCHLELKSVKGRRPFYNILGDNKEEVDKLRKRAKPWIMRRILNGIPGKVHSHITATLSPEEWKMYCDMRETMVAWLKDNPSEAVNGAIKAMRLAQITSGHIGGLSDIMGEVVEDVKKVEEIGSSKQIAFFEWLETIPDNEQVIIWSRFRKELERMQTALLQKGHTFGLIYGGLSDDKRDAAKGDFQRGNIRFLGCQSKAGGFGLNLQNAHISVYLSNDYSYIIRDQSEERIHRRGQEKEQLILDVLAVGPNGEKTIDFEIVKALRRKEEVATWTTAEWLKILE